MSMTILRDLMQQGWRNPDQRIRDTESREWTDAIAQALIDLDNRVGALDQTSLVASGYVGMRYRNDDPPRVQIDQTPVKVTLYDEPLPLLGDPVAGGFDQASSEIFLNEGEGGVYAFTSYFNFEGEQGEIYTLDAYLDQNDGNGPQPAGAPIYAKVSSADKYAELERTILVRMNGTWRWSMWVNANKPNTNFDVFVTTLSMTRVSPKMADMGVVPVLGARGNPRPESDDDDDDDDDDD